MKQINITFAWNYHLKLRAEGGKLRAKGDKLRAKGDKLWAEGGKLWAEGGKLWAEAVLEAYGNVSIEWVNITHCIVDGKDEYKDGG